MSVTLFHGDCLDVLPTLEANSVDSIVTDPPGGISFMGKKWDHDRGGRDQWIAWMTQVASEALRVLKPGGHALVWALPRTSHWTVTAWEDAGFEVRDRLAHVFGSGFPKSHDISKAIDKAAGAERKVVGTKRGTRGADGTGHEGAMPGKATGIKQTGCDVPITAPATPAAAEWDGWGMALKPAMEDWWLLRKPLAEVSSEELFAATGWDFWHAEQAVTHHGRKVTRHSYKALRPGVQSYVELVDGEDVIECAVTGEYEPFTVKSVAANALRWGVAGLWVDGGRIGTNDQLQTLDGSFSFAGSGGANETGKHIVKRDAGMGRWPANLILDGEAGRLLDAQSGERPGCSVSSLGQYKSRSGFGGGQINCAYGDTGGASRFFQRCDWDEADVRLFYIPKASRKERNAGLEGFEERQRDLSRNPEQKAMNGGDGNPYNRGCTPLQNNHPTVKPLALMRYFVRLVTPPGGVVLDMFMGSGTTGMAARLEGFGFVGIEMERESYDIAEARIAWADERAATVAIEPMQISFVGD